MSNTPRKRCVAAMTLAGLAIMGGIILYAMLSSEKTQHAADTAFLNQQIQTLQTNQSAELKISQEAQSKAQSAVTDAQSAQRDAEALEKKNRDQLIALGVANDHLLAWMMRDHSQDLPELHKSDTSRDILLRELHHFLQITSGNQQYQPVRARIMLQLAELEIDKKNPAKADPLIDSAVEAWDEAGVEEPGYAYRIARARLACLIQALDQQKEDLAAKLLPKARKAAKSNPAAEAIENKRLSAVMHVIDGRMIQTKKPAQALKHFEQAIQAMHGIQRTLTEHIIVRSDLARYTLEAAHLAETLHRMEDATRLRGDAASALEKLLKKNPNLQLPKVQLAQIYLLSATAEIRDGNDSDGAIELAQAEKLLATLSANDTAPNGAAMQMAVAKGLRAVLLRDAGKNTEAKQTLVEAIQLAEKIVAAQKNNPGADTEALYRLAVLHWQLAGIIGDGGNPSAELLQGEKAADLMEELLKKKAVKHDHAIRRGLGYLYGDLGHTAAQLGHKATAATYFKKAAIIWQSLITRYGTQEEYADGLKWSQSRKREMTPSTTP